MREFESWAIRSNDWWKIHYFWFTHPAVEQSFWKYMLKHQLCEDWSLRTPSNWWSWWDKSISIDSLTRHVKDLEALEAWMYVYKIRSIEWIENTVFLFDELDIDYAMSNNKNIVSIDTVIKEDCINAIKFNCNAYMLELLKNS